MSKLQEAMATATVAHEGQTRKDGAPYINHPLAVLTILQDAPCDFCDEVLAAAVLHDVIEDTDITLLNLRETFGLRVAVLVHALTRSGEGTRWGYPMSHYYYARIKECGPTVIAIKLADMLHNLRDSRGTDLRAMTVERVRVHGFELVGILKSLGPQWAIYAHWIREGFQSEYTRDEAST